MLLAVCISASLLSCGNHSGGASSVNGSDEGGSETFAASDTNNNGSTVLPEGKNHILVAYFSCTGTTKALAEYAADILSADIYEIVPEVPYTEEDLAYYTDCRADKEQNDPAARPAISGTLEHAEQYDAVILGYPIWHGQAPRIISTFLESYDFSGKTILPFCTSHSSGIGSSADNLHAAAPGANWLDGKRFASGTSG